MTPKYGGDPLPRAPLCLPGQHKKANEYAALLADALRQSGWSRTQRTRLRDRYRVWVWRAEGRDGYFEQYGTFARQEGAPPPTPLDLVVQEWRAKARARGVTSAEMKRRRFPARFRVTWDRREERDRDPQKDRHR